MIGQKYIREILGVVLLFLAVISCISLLSYTPDDISFYTSTPNDPVVNKAGFLGAWAGFIFFFLFGLSAYAMPFVLAYLGLTFFKDMHIKSFIVKVMSGLGFLVILSLLFSVYRFEAFKGVELKLNIVSQGGAVGRYLGGEVFSYYIGAGGAFVLLISLLVVFFLLLTEVSLFKACKMIWTGLLHLAKGIHVFFLYLGTMGKKTSDYLEAKKEEKARRLQEEDSEKPPEVFVASHKKESKAASSEQGKNEKKPLLEKLRRKKEKPVAKPKPPGKKKIFNAALPPHSLLEDYISDDDDSEDDKALLSRSSGILEKTLGEFGLDVKVINIQKGPAVTRYEVSIAPGTKVEKITALSNNIALAMKALSVRIIAPIPGKAAVGIEIPNVKKSIVRLKEMIESDAFHENDCIVPLALGKDISGLPVIVDLADMPHLLIAGATGSGKSVCINAIICTLLFSSTPEDIRFVLIDPKKVELACYKGIPHLYCPIINNSQKASLGLRFLIKEMERRYEVFAHLGVRNIKAYRNYRKKMMESVSDEEQENIPEDLPYIITIIDELADLILVSSSDVQDSIIRLAQLSRAVGMHLVLATQRPSVKVVTGLIKANIPSRISFQLPSKVDSRTVLDANGADKLLGNGDMLFLPPGTSKLIRAQGTYVGDAEIKRLVHYWKDQEPVIYNEEITKKLNASVSSGDDEDEDNLFEEAVKIVIEAGMASASLLQRRLKIGYNRASRIVDSMEDRGIVGPHVGSKGRDIYVESFDDYLSMNE